MTFWLRLHPVEVSLDLVFTTFTHVYKHKTELDQYSTRTNSLGQKGSPTLHMGVFNERLI